MSDERFYRAVYVISVAAELAGLHPQTLRIYERRGLVAPARTPGGSRRYSDADVALLERIAELTEEGLNLAGVQRVLELERSVAALRAELDEVRRAQQRQAAELLARGFRGRGRLMPAAASDASVTLYRATRGPASVIEPVDPAEPPRPEPLRPQSPSPQPPRPQPPSPQSERS